MIVVALDRFQRFLGMTFIENVLIKDPEGILRRFNRVDPDVEYQLLNPEKIAGFEHIELAVLNALDAFQNNRNISRQLSIEILLYASGQRQISKALNMLGLKENLQNILVIAVGKMKTSVENFIASILHSLGGEVNDKKITDWSDDKIKTIIKAYGLTTEEIHAVQREGDELPEVINKILVERMALLSIL